jgi:hypothetical protein
MSMTLAGCRMLVQHGKSALCRLHWPASAGNAAWASSPHRCIGSDPLDIAAQNFTHLHHDHIAYPIPGRRPMFHGVDEAISAVKSGEHARTHFAHVHVGDHIFVQGIAATPTLLLDALCRHALSKDLKGITLHHLHLEGEAKWILDPYKGGVDKMHATRYNRTCRLDQIEFPIHRRQSSRSR